MGLTIHYTIEFEGTTKQLQGELENVRRICLDLPFEKVGERVKTVNITKGRMLYSTPWGRNVMVYRVLRR